MRFHEQPGLKNLDRNKPPAGAPESDDQWEERPSRRGFLKLGVAAAALGGAVALDRTGVVPIASTIADNAEYLYQGMERYALNRFGELEEKYKLEGVGLRDNTETYVRALTRKTMQDFYREHNKRALSNYLTHAQKADEAGDKTGVLAAIENAKRAVLDVALRDHKALEEISSLLPKEYLLYDRFDWKKLRPDKFTEVGSLFFKEDRPYAEEIAGALQERDKVTEEYYKNDLRKTVKYVFARIGFEVRQLEIDALFKESTARERNDIRNAYTATLREWTEDPVIKQREGEEAVGYYTAFNALTNLLNSNQPPTGAPNVRWYLETLGAARALVRQSKDQYKRTLR
jgi:hypothetical protein